MKNKITIMKKSNISDEEILQYMDFDSILSKHRQLSDLKRKSRIQKWLLAGGGIVIVLSISWVVINSSSNQSKTAAGFIESSSSISEDSLGAEKADTGSSKKDVQVDSSPLPESVKDEKVHSARKLKSQEAMDQNTLAQPPKVTQSFVFLPAEPVDGYPALYEYFEKEVKYPTALRADSVKGVVTVAFTINEVGEAENIFVEESLGELFDAEAKRAVQHMPKWKPASYNGKNIASRLSVPITFQIARVKSPTSDN